MAKRLLPYVIEVGKPPVDGQLHPTPEFCKKKFNAKCREHYASIKSPGVKVCKYGYTSVALDAGAEGLQIYSAIADEQNADIPTLRRGNRLPAVVVTREILNSLENQVDHQKRVANELQAYQELVHDLRNINQTLKSSAEDIEDQFLSDRGNVDPYISQRLSSIIAASNLLSQRMSYLRFRQDPGAARILTAGIHKKFFKALQLFRLQGRSKNLDMPDIEGNSISAIDAYDFFDCLPVILLENAVKYSPRGTDIRIKIEENAKTCIVQVENYGPTITDEDLVKIRQGKARGTVAQAMGIPGSGLGLSFANEVCRVHNISLEVHRGDIKVIAGSTNQRFIVRLFFDI